MRSKFLAAALVGLTMSSAASADTKAFTPKDRANAAAAALKVRKVFDRELRDYPTARFRDVTADVAPNDGSIWFCGYVNAKNAYGAYQGWRRFSVTSASDDLMMKTPDEKDSVVDLVCDATGGQRDTRDYSADLTYR